MSGNCDLTWRAMVETAKTTRGHPSIYITPNYSLARISSKFTNFDFDQVSDDERVEALKMPIAFHRFCGNAVRETRKLDATRTRNTTDPVPMLSLRLVILPWTNRLGNERQSREYLVLCFKPEAKGPPVPLVPQDSELIEII